LLKSRALILFLKKLSFVLEAAAALDFALKGPGFEAGP